MITGCLLFSRLELIDRYLKLSYGYIRIDVDRPNILLAIRKPRLESLFPLPVTKDRKSRGEIYVSGWTIVRLRHGFVQLMCWMDTFKCFNMAHFRRREKEEEEKSLEIRMKLV